MVFPGRMLDDLYEWTLYENTPVITHIKESAEQSQSCLFIRSGRFGNSTINPGLFLNLFDTSVVKRTIYGSDNGVHLAIINRPIMVVINHIGHHSIYTSAY